MSATTSPDPDPPAVLTRRPGDPRPAGGLDGATVAIIALVFVFMAYYSAREYIAPDYKVEIVPVFNALDRGGLDDAFGVLPGYPAAAIIELFVGKLGLLVGLSEGDTWRFLSIFGLAVLAFAVGAAARFAAAADVPRGAVWIACAVAVGSPTIYWALRIGHPEEVFTTGFLLAALLAAARERPVAAGLLLGLAIAKAWPVAAALPVLGLLLPSVRRVAIGVVATAVPVAVLYIPSVAFAHGSVQSLTDLGTHSIFNVGQVFWWFGDPIPQATVTTQVVPQPRVGPVWSGELSHPLILGVGLAIGLVWCWSLAARLRSTHSAAPLRVDGRTRSNEQVTALAGAALLVMAGVLYARCYLDTWNVPYYLMPALVLGAFGELLTGRRPLIALVATGIMWKWCTPGDLTVRSAPDVYTAQYLAWTIPASIAYLAMGFRAVARPRAVSAAAPPPAPGPAPAPAAS